MKHSLMDQLIGFTQSVSSQAYPPHSIYTSDNGYTVELALAGWKRPELGITLESGYLFIRGTKATTDSRNAVWKGIASREFEKVFSVSPDLEVKSATLVDGILTIELSRKAESVARKIEIK